MSLFDLKILKKFLLFGTIIPIICPQHESNIISVILPKFLPSQTLTTSFDFSLQKDISILLPMIKYMILFAINDKIFTNVNIHIFFIYAENIIRSFVCLLIL